MKKNRAKNLRNPKKSIKPQNIINFLRLKTQKREKGQNNWQKRKINKRWIILKEKDKPNTNPKTMLRSLKLVWGLFEAKLSLFIFNVEIFKYLNNK